MYDTETFILYHWARYTKKGGGQIHGVVDIPKYPKVTVQCINGTISQGPM